MNLYKKYSAILLLYLVGCGAGFTVFRVKNDVQTFARRRATRLHETSPENNPPSLADVLTGVVAPLKRIGPYTCVGLIFDHWKKGETFDFMLDTGANVNSIDERLVAVYGLEELALKKEGDGPKSLIGVTGGEVANHAGALHMLGDCRLAGLPPPDLTFLRKLVAASLPFASPVGGGLLGLPFFWSFPAGVEFDWHGTDGDPPTLIFYYGQELPAEAAKTNQMTRVPLDVLLGGLLALKIKVNGVEIRALLDTGSPVTVLNDEACQSVGVEEFSSGSPDGSFPALKITGVDGGKSELRMSKEEVTIEIDGTDGPPLTLGRGHVWRGELPGLRMIEQFASKESNDGVSGVNIVKEVPAIVLGLDFLQQAYRMVLRAPKNEVWFEEMTAGFLEEQYKKKG